ncbi:MAG: TIGR00725 family protein [Myxococcales bacterium]|nr:TIGR00725 family protein [Myxococcales bacterium]
MVAIIGAGEAPPAILAVAEELGRRLVDAGLRIVSGGRGGVMAAASRGGRASSAWAEGAILGILPGVDRSDANPWIDVALPTGLGHARNVLVVLAAEVVIAVDGGAGTLSEIALAWVHERPIIALDVGDGWSGRLAGARLDGRQDAAIERATSPAEAVALALAHLGERAWAPPAGYAPPA